MCSFYLEKGGEKYGELALRAVLRGAENVERLAGVGKLLVVDDDRKTLKLQDPEGFLFESWVTWRLKFPEL